MLEVARYEAERRVVGSVVVSVSLAAFGGMMLLVAPGLLEQVDLTAYAEQLPPSLVESFGLEQIGTLAGFMAAELYVFGWVFGLGTYVAYLAAGSLAGRIDDGTVELVLAAPISRSRLLAETYAASLLPVALANVVVAGVVYGGSVLIDDPLPLADVVAVHALSVPYLLCCAAIGTLCSVLAPNRRVAEGAGAGAIAATYVVSVAVTGSDIDWLGAVAPARYYDPVAVLTAGEYDLGGAAVLLGATALLLAAAAFRFREVDV
ncbi:ABC transporter permease subunit [Halobaculum roseum]|uniref:ABC transporter permease subunit n=1 Tax=Halobaculum roseum TaxID=2175149 RepID=A0ABD5MKQ8_9EURY|nr:ABC transporter permease subunit [Halobaculum roseum]QZY01420.1 ABC transporter permease subunit [Halobaculum roseum]